MTETKTHLGKHIRTVNLTEAVVEIYFDKERKLINELKCLNYNRSKVYSYTLEEYIDSISRYKLDALIA